ncbi:MAG: hypothetical protein FJ297_10895 [Planctomycetes bacterium]|nr:hypothetical protein [Planctomycetota bacterium]
MIDFEIQRCTRRCAATDRELRPGEAFYSVLTASGDQVVRTDYSLDGWPGPPADAVGWWRSHMPSSEPARKSWAPGDVMLDYFQRLPEGPDHDDLRYVLALLMTRRKIVTHESTERDELGRERMVLYCPRTEQEFRVDVVIPDARRASRIQDELGRLFQ